MSDLVLVGLAGFVASLVDGALGMGFGPTSASILLGTGLSPAATSATVNLAKVASGMAAGVSHWRLGNIDRRLVLRLAGPGMGGALIGATILTQVDGEDLRPVLAVLLVLVGLRILLRFSRPLPRAARQLETDGDGNPRFAAPGAAAIGAAGGLTNGLIGAWGPVVTPFLLQRGVPPRYVVGSVNTAEIAVAVVAAGSLVTSASSAGLEVAIVLAMLGGGVAAAPLAAYVVRYLPARLLGLAVAGLLLLTQSRELTSSDVVPVNQWVLYTAVGSALFLAALRPRLRSIAQHRRARPASTAHPSKQGGRLRVASRAATRFNGRGDGDRPAA